MSPSFSLVIPQEPLYIYLMQFVNMYLFIFVYHRDKVLCWPDSCSWTLRVPPFKSSIS